MGNRVRKLWGTLKDNVKPLRMSLARKARRGSKLFQHHDEEIHPEFQWRILANFRIVSEQNRALGSMPWILKLSAAVLSLDRLARGLAKNVADLSRSQIPG